MKRDIPQELPFDFCENCLMYDPKIDSTCLYANDEKTVYNIVCRCENEAVCRNVEKMLKNQTSIVPIKNDTYYSCGDCGGRLWVANQKFCASCGKSVKWG